MCATVAFKENRTQHISMDHIIINNDKLMHKKYQIYIHT